MPIAEIPNPQPVIPSKGAAGGGAGVSRGTTSRLRNGIAMQGNTPLLRLRSARASLIGM